MSPGVGHDSTAQGNKVINDMTGDFCFGSYSSWLLIVLLLMIINVVIGCEDMLEWTEDNQPHTAT